MTYTYRTNVCTKYIFRFSPITVVKTVNVVCDTLVNSVFSGSSRRVCVVGTSTTVASTYSLAVQHPQIHLFMDSPPLLNIILSLVFITLEGVGAFFMEKAHCRLINVCWKVHLKNASLILHYV